MFIASLNVITMFAVVGTAVCPSAGFVGTMYGVIPTAVELNGIGTRPGRRGRGAVASPPVTVNIYRWVSANSEALCQSVRPVFADVHRTSPQVTPGTIGYSPRPMFTLLLT